MKITGQILKENRERKGISISEVAIATKINNKTLIAIEEGNADQLPPKTFLRGFVRAYATYLELDVDSVMSTYYEEMGSTRPKPEVTETSEAPAPARQRSTPNEANDAINPKTSLAVKVGAVTGILLLVVLIVIFKNKMESYEKEALDKSVPGGISALETSETPAPTPEAASGTPTADASPTQSPTPQASASPTPSATPVAAVAAPTATPTPAPTATPTATPSPTPKPTATPTPTPSPSPTPKPTPTPSPAPTATPVAAAAAVTPTPTPTPKTGRPQEVIVEALDNVDVDVQIDDEPAKKLKLRSEQVQNIKAKRKVILRFSDGGAVNLIVNGVERGVPGDLGKPVRVELP